MKTKIVLSLISFFLIFNSFHTSAQNNDCGNNAGFETGTTTGWTCKSGSYGALGICYTPCTPGCPGFPLNLNQNGCLNPGGVNAPLTSTTDRHTITTGAGTDPNSGNTVPVVAPGGGTYSFRLGNAATGGTGGTPNLAQSEAIRLSFLVTAQNAGFTYRYAAFLQDPGHPAESQPRFEISVMDSRDSIIPCGYYKVVSGSNTTSGCTGTGGFLTNGTWRYTRWTDVGLDLTGYIGQTISIEFRTADCFPPSGSISNSTNCTNGVCTTTISYNGITCNLNTCKCTGNLNCNGTNYNPGTHAAYAYVDAYCSPLTIDAPKICGTDSIINICAPAGYASYSWPAGQPGLSGSPTTRCVNVNVPAGSTRYTVNMISKTGCPTTTTVTLTKTDVLVKDTTYCQGSIPNLTLTATPTTPGQYTYSWTGPGGFTSNQQNPVITPAPTQSGIYTVTVSDTSACAFTKNINVTVNSQLPITASADTAFCIGGKAQLNANPGTNYSYTWTPADGTLDKTNVPNPIASPTVTTTYTVSVTNGSGCAGKDSVKVTVNQLPVIIPAPANPTICVGDSITLRPAGATSYTWFPPTGLSSASGTSVNASPAATTSYTITGTDANSCVNTATFTLTVNPLPKVIAFPRTPQICLKDSITLTASGAFSYAWLPRTSLSSDTGIAVTAVPSATITYTVTGTDANGCKNKDSSVVTVKPLPVVIASADTAICIQKSTPISATGLNSYSWTPPATLVNPNTANPIATPTMTTTYIVSGLGTNGCKGSDSVKVTVNQLPVIIPTPANPAICIGDSVTLRPSGASTYTWLPITGLSSASGNPINASPSATTSYTITGTDANTCVNTTTFTLTVNPLPKVIASPRTPQICLKDSVNITAGGALSYKWSPNTGLATDTGAAVTATPINTITYTVTGTDANGCMNKDSSVVTVKPLPVVIASADTAICIQKSTPISATGLNSYSWTPPATLVNPNTASPIATPTVTTTYTVSGLGTNGCKGSDSVKVTVNQLPVITLTPANPAICIGDSVTLRPGGASTYTWFPVTGLSSASGNPINASPGATTAYTITGTDANTCVNTTAFTLTVNSLPNVIVSPRNAEICLKESVVLTAGGALSYTWSPGTKLSPETGAVVTATPTATITYTVTGTDINTCKNKDSATVIVHSLPPANAGPDARICIGSSIPLSATGGIGFSWSPATGLSDSLTATPNASPVITTAYTVSVTDSNGCKNTDSMILNVDTLPKPDAGTDQQICFGQTAQLNGSGGASFLWKPGSANIANPVVKPDSSTTYTVIVTNGICPSDSDEVFITVHPLPLITAGTDTTIFAGTDALLFAAGGSNYTWSPAEGLTCTDCANPVANPVFTTLYTVTTTDSNGCSSSIIVKINVLDIITLYVPNAFTPANQDNKNDVLYAYGTGIKNFTFMIFNRWGDLIFETTDLEKGWDGTYKNKPAQSGVYIYVAKAESYTGKSYTKNGTIAIVR